jgi:hypothetical protein
VDGDGDGAEAELQLLVDEGVAVGAGALDDVAELVDRSDSCRAERYADSSPSERPARRTRPMEVAYAGSRAPTPRATVMMRLVGTRATYTMSGRSRVAIEQDSWVFALSSSMNGPASSPRSSDDKYAQPRASTRGVSEKRRPSLRTYPSSSSVSRIRRAVAGVMPTSRATSLRVSDGAAAENARITASPRSSPCRNVPVDASPAIG